MTQCHEQSISSALPIFHLRTWLSIGAKLCYAARGHRAVSYAT